jgi:hypothetical protein
MSENNETLRKRIEEEEKAKAKAAFNSKEGSLTKTNSNRETLERSLESAQILASRWAEKATRVRVPYFNEKARFLADSVNKIAAKLGQPANYRETINSLIKKRNEEHARKTTLSHAKSLESAKLLSPTRTVEVVGPQPSCFGGSCGGSRSKRSTKRRRNARRSSRSRR